MHCWFWSSLIIVGNRKNIEYRQPHPFRHTCGGRGLRMGYGENVILTFIKGIIMTPVDGWEFNKDSLFLFYRIYSG